MPPSSSPTRNRLDRYKLGEDVVLALDEVLFTIDPSFGSEWKEVAAAWAKADDAVRELWRQLRPDTIRYDPRMPDSVVD